MRASVKNSSLLTMRTAAWAPSPSPSSLEEGPAPTAPAADWWRGLEAGVPRQFLKTRQEGRLWHRRALPRTNDFSVAGDAAGQHPTHGRTSSKTGVGPPQACRCSVTRCAGQSRSPDVISAARTASPPGAVSVSGTHLLCSPARSLAAVFQD